MSGIYIHIPFCKQACHYCDFHFSTNTSRRTEMVKAISKELKLQRNYLNEEKVSSIYFGGGTPSLLSQSELDYILDEIKSSFHLATEIEITLEANPDDITADKIQAFTDSGINRLSIGIQSFQEDTLKWMNRAHNHIEAQNCIALVNKSSIKDFSLDFIYGIPNKSNEDIIADLKRFISCKPTHISAYCLTIEPKTVFGSRHQKGKLKEIDEDHAAEQFLLINEHLSEAGYIHYEVSNYCLPGYESFHNTNYWKSVSYLGVGPSAHSFNTKSRQYNVANNARYLKLIEQNELPFQLEVLSKEDQINEYMMTSLRTKDGLSTHYIKTVYGYDILQENSNLILQWEKDKLCKVIDRTVIKLTLKGLLVADKLASDLFIVA